MKRRILSILLVLAMCLTLLPTAAWAIDYSYPSTTDAAIGSTILTSGTYYLIDNNGQLSIEKASETNYNIYYSTDTETGTHSLTLNNANLKSPIYVLGGTTVTLMGENFGGSETSKVSIGIQGITSGSITITGTGSYTAYSTNEGIATVQSDGTDARSDIVIQGGTISLPGSSIDTRYGGITITGGANVEAKEISTGGDPNHEEAQRARPIVITGTGTKVKAERIDCLTTITVSGSAEVTVKNTSGIAMSAEDGIDILENASVDASGKSGGLNSFGGSIVIEGTASATLTGQPVQVNGGMNGSAAVSVGTNAAPTATRSITVKGKLTVESTFVGIWTWGTGDITIDGGEVSVTTPYYGIMTRMSASTDATGGNLAVQNKGKLTINGAMGTYPQASNCTLTVDNSTVNTTTSAWGLYWPGQIVLRDSTVTCANSGSDNLAIGTATGIQYKYTDSYKVTAGASASAAELVPHADLSSTVYQSNYVKIEPATSYSITVTGGSASVEKTTEGETVTITADIPEGQRFVNWTSSNDNVTFADASAATTTFTMPASDVTIMAITTSTAQEAPADAPQLASRTTSSITLKEVAANTNGAAAQYGISTDGGDTWTWQATPAFTGLTSGTEYTFAVRYGATEDGNYVASPASPTAAFSTERPVVIPTYTPTVEPADNGTTSVTPKNPRQGVKVTITTTPDEGFEVDSVTVTDRKGNPVTVTDNGDGTYSFTQPAGKVTISVTYKEIYVPCDGGVNCPAYHFTDVDTSEWYHEAVDYVVENGLMIGTSETTFEPDATTTRAMLVTVLYRLENEPEISGVGIFDDVPEGEYYSEAVAWAAANGIVNGYGDGTFGPDDILTREQMAAIMFRYAAYKGYDVTDRANLSDYIDADTISDYAVDAMAWVNATGIINGTSETSLEPLGDATRCQFAAILYRFCENVAE